MMHYESCTERRPWLTAHCAHMADLQRTESAARNAVDGNIRANPLDHSLVAACQQRHSFKGTRSRMRPRARPPRDRR